MDERHRERHQAFLDECERLLHNALSAVHSRVDLLRTFISRYVAESTPTLATEYRLRVDSDFVENPIHNFLTGLRNYMLHERLPATVGVFTILRNSSHSFAYQLATGPLIAAADGQDRAERPGHAYRVAWRRPVFVNGWPDNRFDPTPIRDRSTIEFVPNLRCF
jgi:hypothetical protein